MGSLRYERNKFALRPFGGSLVILTPVINSYKNCHANTTDHSAIWRQGSLQKDSL